MIKGLRTLATAGLLGLATLVSGCGPKLIASGDVDGKHYDIYNTWGGGKLTEVTLTNGTKITYRDPRFPEGSDTLDKIYFETYSKGKFNKDYYNFGTINSFTIRDGTNTITQLSPVEHKKLLEEATIEVKAAAATLFSRKTKEVQAQRQALLDKLK